MQIIQEQKTAIRDLLPSWQKESGEWVMNPFCVRVEEEEGSLLYHVQTRELLLLEQGEWPESYLKQHYFLVPRDFDVCDAADQVRQQLRFFYGVRVKGYNYYTILPTTDCNARCFYCFEIGCERITMSRETAEKVVQYIKETAAPGQELKLRFFGGEPLLGQNAIDTITSSLQEYHIPFSSFIITNGYLFDEDVVALAGEKWNLKGAQITLDGTEKIYNARKAYIDRPENAFFHVMNNIEHLLKAGIKVDIRLNLDEKNYDDLCVLVDQLADRLGDYSGINVYANLLFQILCSEDSEKRDRHFRLLTDLQKRIKEKGIQDVPSLSDKTPLYYCMAADPSAVVILPDGRLFSCEEFTAHKAFGHIDTKDGKDQDLLYWLEQFPRDEACHSCPLYPICFRQQHCPDKLPRCLAPDREMKIEALKESIHAAYEKWKNR